LGAVDSSTSNCLDGDLELWDVDLCRRCLGPLLCFERDLLDDEGVSSAGGGGGVFGLSVDDCLDLSGELSWREDSREGRLDECRDVDASDSVSSFCLWWGIVSILVLTACMCGCLSSGFLVLVESPYFLSFLLGFARVNSIGVISLSSSESTGEMFAWNTSIVSFDCPNCRSSAGSPLVFSDNMHVSRVSW
jgi:hypothetical protein